MLIGDPHDYANSTYRAQIAKLDVAILGMYNGWNGGVFAASVNAIKALNPSILLGNYTIMTEVPTASGGATAAKWTKLTAEHGPSGIGDWWAYDAAGAHTDWSAGAFGSYDTNLTLLTTPDSNGDRWPQWVAKNDYSEIIQGVNWDIWYSDNNMWKPRDDPDWNRSGSNDSQDSETTRNWWRDGQRAYYDQVRATAPGLALWVNADSDLDGSTYPTAATPFTQYKGVADGAFIEHGMGETWSVEEWGGWQLLMTWYRTLKANLTGPKHVLLDAYFPSTTDYQYARYALASTLMDDGFFSASTDYAQVLWFDEFDLAGTASTKWLGAASDPPQTSAWSLGVYRRNFANGTVLVNPKGNGSRTVTIGSGYHRIAGTQAPAVNSGAAVTSTVTLADRDGLLLVKP
jgi:hypothetical protein